MATKSFTASAAYPNMQLKLDLSSTANVAANKSTVSWDLYLYVVVAGNYNYSNGNSVNCTLNGTAYINTSNIRAISISGLPVGSKVALGSGSFDVSHSSDGTKSISVSASFIQTQNANASYSISGTFTLDNIARASQPTLSASSVALGSAVTITTNRASSSFTHTLTYKFGSATGTIATGVGASTSWTPPASLASQIPNSTSGSCTITCTTYSGSTSVGSKTVTLTLTVPNNSTYNPTLSLTLAEPSNHTTTYGGYVQNKSKFQITASPGYKYGATFASLTVSANGTSYTMSASSLTVTTNVLTTSGTNTVTATLKDSRGRSVTATASASVQAYTSPTISTLTASRCDSSGNADDGGSYMKISVSAAITALGNKNGKTFTLQYKKTSAASYTTHATYTAGYTYSSAPVIAADTDSSYDIKITATDSFGSAIKTASVSTAFTLMDFHSSGKGIAFGKVAETENLFDSSFDISVKGQRIGTTSISGIGDGTLTGAIKKINESKVVGWKTVQDLGTIALNNSVTVSSSGIVRCYINPSTINGASARVYVTNKGSFGASSKDGTGVFFVIPVNKSDKLTVTIANGITGVSMSLIPFDFNV